ncbi:MAG: hypothetical protein IKQ71_02465 [Lachnospiraceae bacterium]|nr:hypothetical protein [Lachnospiraceae bacterium]
MGKVILCETKTAKEPFVFLNTKVYVYSYEEFCYYVYNNQILVTMDIIDLSLCDWFEKQLDLKPLADELKSLMEKESPLEDYLIKILMFKNYYDVNEIKSFVTEYEAGKLLRPNERDKKIADGYLKYKRYTKAISMYKQLLVNEDKIADQIFLGNVYHNMAVALANNMQLNEARLAFLKAFTLNENEISLRSCFMVMASYEPEDIVKREMRKYHLPDNYLAAIMEEVANAKEEMEGMQLYHRLEKAMYNREHGDMKGYLKRIDSVVSEIKETFREQTI